MACIDSARRDLEELKVRLRKEHRRARRLAGLTEVAKREREQNLQQLARQQAAVADSTGARWALLFDGPDGLYC